MKKYRYYPLEFKLRLIQEIESGLRSKAAIAREEKIACSLIDHWQKKVRDGTLVDHPSAPDRQLMKENDWLKKKVAEQAMEIDLLKKNRRVLSTHEKVEWVHRHRAEYGVTKGCEIMDICTSTYYYKPKKSRAVRGFQDAQLRCMPSTESGQVNSII